MGEGQHRRRLTDEEKAEVEKLEPLVKCKAEFLTLMANGDDVNAQGKTNPLEEGKEGTEKANDNEQEFEATEDEDMEPEDDSVADPTWKEPDNADFNSTDCGNSEEGFTEELVTSQDFNCSMYAQEYPPTQSPSKAEEVSDILQTLVSRREVRVYFK